MSDLNGHRHGDKLKIVIGGARRDQIDQHLMAWQAEFPQVDFHLAQTDKEQISLAPGTDAWLGRISRDAFVAAGPQLKWVHSTGVGIETLTAIRELVESDVTLTNVRGGHSANVAEHAFALLLALTRRIPDATRNQAAHSYKKLHVNGALDEISGDLMVVVGFGNIGRAIARRAVGFDMRVIGVDVLPVPKPEAVEAVVTLDRLNDVLPLADVVIVAAPYTTETYNLIDGPRLALMKSSAYLIAVSRGGIVDEVALAEALHAGRLAGAGLDVQSQEPLPADDPLWDAPNILITPHCASSSRKTSERVWAITRENVYRFVNGLPLNNVCDKKAGY